MFHQILNTPLDDSLSNRQLKLIMPQSTENAFALSIYSSSNILLVVVAKSTLPSMLEEILDDPLMVVLKTNGEFKFFSPLVILMKTFRVVATTAVIILFYQGG